MATNNNCIEYKNPVLVDQIDNFPYHKDHLSMHLSGQKLKDEDISIVVEHGIMKRQCTYLDLHNNEITSEGASILASSLTNNTTLEDLYLHNNRISDKGAYALTQALSNKNNVLGVLTLDLNQITDVGVQHLSLMLTTNQRLTNLTLYGNEISDQGVQLLANALVSGNDTLVQLDLHENKMITDSSINSLIDIIEHNKSLKILDVRSCNLSDQSKERLNKTAKKLKDLKVFV